MSQHETNMLKAIECMREAGVVKKTGGPFGCVIADSKTGAILVASGNSVMTDSDPTAHAEVNAIRKACKLLNTVNLSGYTLYTSCMTCPMCYSASYWARLDKLYYAAACEDYADVFDDVAIYEDLDKPLAERSLKPEELCRREAQAVWKEFKEMPDGARY
jgi:guanine deaminase